MIKNPQSAEALTFSKRVVAFALSLVLRIINSTLRWEKYGLEISEKHWTLGAPTIMVFWHGDQLMMPWAYISKYLNNGSKKLNALVSMHNDGRIAANALGHLEINTVDGSSSRGALRSLLQLRQKLTTDQHVAITPDGPKGPHHVAKSGAVLLSSTSGARLLPITIVVEKYWQLKSWDKMFIPKPFSRAIILAADPYVTAPNLSREELGQESLKLAGILSHIKEQATQLLTGPVYPLEA